MISSKFGTRNSNTHSLATNYSHIVLETKIKIQKRTNQKMNHNETARERVELALTDGKTAFGASSPA